MLKSVALDVAAFGALVAFSSPAFAGVVVTPAPIAGVGIGAVALIGFGYRALKRRAKR
ncbi:MAG: hypothetical protein ABIS51_02985 [Sphingomonas sp.]|jgi:hypothetical protein